MTHPWIASVGLISGLLAPFAGGELPPEVPPFFTMQPAEVPMYDSVHAAFKAFTKPLEGILDCMYLDQHRNPRTGALEPLVTTGEGNLIDDGPRSADRAAPALEFTWTRLDGSVASEADVRAEFARVLSLSGLALKGGGAFAKGARLHLTPESLAAGIERTLTDYDSVLRVELGGSVYDNMIADAQLATIDMAWAMGPGFVHGYPEWTSAVRRGDYMTAARECGISHPVNASIDARNAANRILFKNAAVVAATGLPPGALVYPAALELAPATDPAPAASGEGPDA